jgi:hypothetical protein
MKKAFLLLTLLGITFLGCSEDLDNTLVSNPIQIEELTKSPNPANLNNLTGIEEFPKSADFEALTHSTTSKDIKDQVFTSVIVKSKSIDGINGGWFMVDTTYVNYQGRLLYVHAEITVLQNTFQDTTEIMMILNPEEASITFLPHMVFDREVRVSVEFMGIDLKELGYRQNGHVDFAFFDDDGSTEMIPAQQSHVNVSTKTIKVLNARIQHFSRYGWIR